MAELKTVTTVEAVKGSVTKKDWVKGLIMATIAPITTGVIALLLNLVNLISGGNPIPLPSVKAQLIVIGLTGLVAGLSYIQKQFLTNSSGQFMTKEPPPAE